MKAETEGEVTLNRERYGTSDRIEQLRRVEDIAIERLYGSRRATQMPMPLIQFDRPAGIGSPSRICRQLSSTTNARSAVGYATTAYKSRGTIRGARMVK